MSFPDSIKGILQDPPPEFAFEITADGIAMSRTRLPAAMQYAALPEGAIVPSPVKDNVVDAVAFADAVKRLVPPGTARTRRTAALLLPDNCLRIAVLDFDKLPDKEEDRRALIKFRMRKTLPFDIDDAALSWCVQPGTKVIAAVAPTELIARYEAPFRAAGLHPGFVTASSLALLELIPATVGSVLLAHRTPGTLTVLALRNGVVELSRTLELSSGESEPDAIEEISQDLYPTLIYVEDQTGARPQKLVLAGFGDVGDNVATRLSVELDIAAEALGDEHPGLAGYLESVAPSRGKAAA